MNILLLRCCLRRKATDKINLFTYYKLRYPKGKNIFTHKNTPIGVFFPPLCDITNSSPATFLRSKKRYTCRSLKIYDISDIIVLENSSTAKGIRLLISARSKICKTAMVLITDLGEVAYNGSKICIYPLAHNITCHS